MEVMQGGGGRLLTPEVTADYLSVTTGTLAVWRCTGRYPALEFTRLGNKRIRYPEDSVRAFARQNLGKPGKPVPRKGEGQGNGSGNGKNGTASLPPAKKGPIAAQTRVAQRRK